MTMHPDGDTGQLRRLLGLLYLTLCVVYLMWGLWETLPEHKRTALCIRLLRSLHQVTSLLARRAGAASLAREAATGSEQYQVPLWLSQRRDDIQRTMDGIRGPLA
jgi:hypothetical protein